MINSNSMALILYSPMTTMEFIRLEAQKRARPNLPEALIVYIFSFLDLRSFLSSSLVSRDWKRISTGGVLDIEKARFSPVWKYRFLSEFFYKNKRIDNAIEASEECRKLDPFAGAYSYRDLCKQACDNKDYETARHCQQLAKKYNIDAGNEAMCYLIKSQVADANFLENEEKLVGWSENLINDDREFGLQALMAVAKKFADLKLFDIAMTYTQKARVYHDSKNCYRRRNHNHDVHPFTEMGRHMLTFKQYKLAEECARKLEKKTCHSDILFAEIIVQQIEEENFINESLFSEMKAETIPWITAIEAIIFVLIAQGRHKEADIKKKIRKSCIMG